MGYVEDGEELSGGYSAFAIQWMMYSARSGVKTLIKKKA